MASIYEEGFLVVAYSVQVCLQNYSTLTVHLLHRAFWHCFGVCLSRCVALGQSSGEHHHHENLRGQGDGREGDDVTANTVESNRVFGPSTLPDRSDATTLRRGSWPYY